MSRFLIRALAWLLHPIALCLTAQLFAFAALHAALAAAPAEILHDRINTDTLFPFHVGRDVLIDGYSHTTWHYSIAPFLLPDVFLASGLLLLCGGDMPAAFALYGIVQFTLLVGGAVFGVLALGLRRPVPALVGVLGGGVALTLIDTMHHSLPRLFGEAWFGQYVQACFPRYLFQAGMHAGSYVTAVWSLGLLIWLVRRGCSTSRDWLALIALAGLCFLGCLSNLLHVVTFVGPAVAVCLLVVWNRPERWRHALTLSLLSILPTLAGRLVAVTTLRMAPMGVQVTGQDRVGVALSFARQIGRHLRSGDLGHSLAVSLVLVGVAALIVVLIRRQRPLWLPGLPLIATALGGLGTLAAMSWGGRHTGIPIGEHYYTFCHRYLQPFHTAPWLALGALLVALLAWLARAHANAATRLVALTWLAIAVALFATRPAGPSFFRHRPEFVRVVDELHKQGRGGDVVGGYWSTRLVTLYSRRGLRGYPLQDNKPFWNNGNAAWFTAPLTPRQPLLLVSIPVRNEPDEATLIAQFGEPREIVRASGGLILIYDRPDDPDLTCLLRWQMPARRPSSSEPQPERKP